MPRVSGDEIQVTSLVNDKRSPLAAIRRITVVASPLPGKNADRPAWTLGGPTVLAANQLLVGCEPPTVDFIPESIDQVLCSEIDIGSEPLRNMYGFQTGL